MDLSNYIPRKINGFDAESQAMFDELLQVYSEHSRANKTKERYYEGRVRLDEVNLGLALPHGMRGLEIGCAWGAKTVDVLASRSMFDGFVASDGTDVAELAGIVRDNNLIAEYPKACRDELKLGASFATLSADADIGCKIKFHSENTAAAVWDGEKNRIAYGFAIVASELNSAKAYVPTLINMHTDTAIWVLRKENETKWTATKYPHMMGEPLMVPLIYNPTSAKPLGQSRIKEPIRRLIQGYVRTVANATIGLEFSTSPQKYLMGVTDDQYDEIVNSKFKQYIGSILAGTVNPETGEKPTFGQLPQGTITPHVNMLRMLATQFSAATGLTVTDTGVVNDANPTSADAVEAQSQTLILMAEQLNAGNNEALRKIGMMAIAIKNGTNLDGLTPEQKDIVAHFKNPSLPSVAATADAAVKIAGVREGFGQTDTFLRMIGFSQADIRLIRAEEQRARGLQLLGNLEETTA